MLQGHEKQNAKASYDNQKTATWSAAQRANEELDRLKNLYQCNLPALCSMEERAARKKLLFMSAQVKTAQILLKTFISQEGVWQLRDFTHSPNADEQVKRNRYYYEAGRLLLVIQRSFEHTVHTETGYFAPIFERMQTVLEDNPKLLKGIVLSGAVSGGIIGSGIHGLAWPDGILHFGLHAKLVALFGNGMGSIVGGAAGGALVGLCLACIVMAMMEVVYQWNNETEEASDSEDRKKLNKLVAELEKKDLSDLTDSIVELSSLFNDCFLQPVELANRDDICCICLDWFPADGGSNSYRPTKAPHCVGNHFVHMECHQQWVSKSGSVQCTICRQ